MRSLIDEVFSWSFHDILNEQFYQDKVEDIPDSFVGAAHYFGSFVYPLLEETRAQLASSLSNVSKAPYAQAVEVCKRNGDEERVYDVKVDYWRNLFGVGRISPYKVCPGDVLLLTDFKPEAGTDFDSDVLWLCSNRASLAQVRVDNDQTDICLLVNHSSSEFGQHMSSERPLYVVFLLNLQTSERMFSSLHMSANAALTNLILGSSTQDGMKCELCTSRYYLSGVDDYVMTLTSELNKSQREVVFDILSKVHCAHKSFVELVWGPPGTGKTKTLSILLFALLKMDCRTLICAPTDIAIVQLVSLLMKLVKMLSPRSLGKILYLGDNHAAKVDTEMKEIHMDYDDRSTEIRLQTASLVFCTASNAYMLQSMKAEPLDLLIIDESAQLKEAESCIPLQLPGYRHIVLFGDHHQLRAEVTSTVSARAGFARSLFERLISMGHSNHILSLQYRMHPSISCFPSKQFYAGQIVDATTVRNRNCTKCLLPGPIFGPYSFINVSCGYEEFDTFRNSFKNMVEVSLVITILNKLFKAWSTNKHNLSVGVVSPFIAQVVAVKEKLGRKYDNIDGFSVKVVTIEGFQGSEGDVIILSTVTTDADRTAGFISNAQKTNIALTRARHCLWIVGDAKSLSGCNSTWKFVIQDAKDRRCLHDAEEDQDLAGVIIQVKKELEQFDSLLNGDSLLFKNARWKVLFSSNFRKSFDKLKSLETKKLVINLLLRLSCGWRPKRGSSYCDSSSRMLRQFKVKHMHIICSVDIQKDSCYIQVLKVWDLLPMDGIPQLVKRLDSLFKSYGDEFVQRCKTRFREGDLEVPMSWNTSVDRYEKVLSQHKIDSSSCVSEMEDYVENCQTSDSLLLMKFYSLSTGAVSHLLSGCDGNEMDLPFELTEEEKDVVFFRRSSFILGRSGCGKTTVLIMKLFQNEQLHHLALEGFHEVESNNMCTDENEKDILRQVFVTVNPRLCYSVRQYISRLKRWTCGWNSDEESSNKTMEEDIDEMSEFSDIPDSLVDLPKCSYPLVITFKKFMMMLNGTVGSSFFERFPELQGSWQQRRRGCRSMTLKTFIRTKEVDYAKFCTSYWPKFSNHLTQQLDMSSVFTEITSHIKGGFRAGVSDDILSRKGYISYSARRLRALTEDDRGRIYDTYVEYERQKAKRGEYDMSDFVIYLHQKMRDEKYKGDRIDFVYVDEVQDLTMRQISLFKHVCRNFEEGFVFSGDTAQTIVRGIDFKFENIRALFYKEFIECERRSKGKITDVFHLKQNFRTHAGVLKLANSILELLHHFFPESFDKLEPESSLLNGQKPVWLQTENGTSGLASLFKKGNMYHAFGAKQVILVRDEDDKRELFDLLGKQTLVLTVMDCKGLEFDDVLLYNFFGSSPVRDQWDLIYGYMEEQRMHGSLSRKPFPIFDEGKHIALCSELKHLYVAITRTRQRLWVLDEENMPIFRYWNEQCLVKVCKLNEAFVQEILVESSPTEWKAQGIKFFHQKSYEKAQFCFEKAGDAYWSLWAKAAFLRCTGESLSYINFKGSRDHLIEAALVYEKIDKNESAAECLFEAHEYEKAGMLYLDKFGDSKLEDAAECFSLAGSYEKAAEIYARCKSFGKCLSVCASGRLFELGYEYIQTWKAKNLITEERFITSGEIQSFLEEAASHFNKVQDSESMMRFVTEFEAKDQMRAFLKRKYRLDELMLLEKEWGNLSEAIEVAKMKGDVDSEIELLEIAERFEEASKLVIARVLYNSLWVKENRGWPLQNFREKQVLLERAKTLASDNVSSGFYEFICCTTNILLQGRDNLHDMKRKWNDTRRYGNLMCKILCSRQILDIYSNHRFDSDLVSLSQNKTSWQKTSTSDLLFYWDCWHREIVILLERIHDHSRESSHTEFCENYFGVTKLLKKEKTVYVLLYPEAKWVNFRFVKQKGNLQWMDHDNFVHAVRGFWSSELVTVGLKVLEILRDLYIFAVDNDLSSSCKCMLLTQIYNTAKPLIESKYMNHKGCDIRVLESFVEVTTDYLFGSMYQLDWQKLLTQDMINLRENRISRKLLKEMCPTKSEKIGMLMTAVLSVQFHPPLLKQVAGCIGNSTLWTDFIEILWIYGEEKLISSDTNSSPEDYVEFEMLVVQKFHEALQATDFMEFSPTCFCYLLDRLLLMASCLNRDFATSRCSLVEWLIFTGWRENPALEFGGVMHVFKSETVDFVASVVEKLLSNGEDMLEWIKKYEMSIICYPELVLRLFVILAVLYVNFGGFSGLFFDLLGRREITSLLPWKFYRCLKKLTEVERKETEIGIVAEAFKETGNPLVIVNAKPDLKVRHAKHLNLKVKQQKWSTLRYLGLKDGSFQPERTSNRKFGLRQSHRRPLSLKIDKRVQNSAPESPDATDELPHCNKHFWMMIGSVAFEACSQGTEFASDVSLLKQLVLDYIIQVNAAMRSILVHDHERSFGEENEVVDQLQQLYSVLCLSPLGDEDIRMIQGIVEKLLSGRSVMEARMDELLKGKPSLTNIMKSLSSGKGEKA